MIDIDGPNRGANVYGKDLFYFYYKCPTNIWTTTELRPSGSKSWGESGFLTNGMWTGHWILKYDNLDYLKCPNNLSDDVTTCPN